MDRIEESPLSLDSSGQIAESIELRKVVKRELALEREKIRVVINSRCCF